MESIATPSPILYPDMLPGSRVMVFDHLLFKDDVSTPLSFTMRPATVICRYGQKINESYTNGNDWIYEDMVDVQFDHWNPGRISKGHFTNYVSQIDLRE